MNHRFNLRRAERKLIVEALQTTWHHQAKAARLLGVSPRVLNYKMKQHGIPRALVDHVVPVAVVKQRAKEGREARRASVRVRRQRIAVAQARAQREILNSLGT